MLSTPYNRCLEGGSADSVVWIASAILDAVAAGANLYINRIRTNSQDLQKGWEVSGETADGQIAKLETASTAADDGTQPDVLRKAHTRHYNRAVALCDENKRTGCASKLAILVGVEAAAEKTANHLFTLDMREKLQKLGVDLEDPVLGTSAGTVNQHIAYWADV